MWCILQFPFLVFDGDVITVCDSVSKVKQFSDDCYLLKQWPGQWRSDWFYTTVGQWRKKIDAKA